MTAPPGVPEKEAAAPLPSRTATATNITASQSSRQNRREDGYAPPSAEDRADAEVIAAAQQRGYRIAVPCIVCGRFLTQKSSVSAHVGPVCRKRVTA